MKSAIPRKELLGRLARALAEAPGASLAEIATRSVSSRATIHRHFGTREELIRELALESIREIDEASARAMAAASSASDAYRRMLAAIAPLGDRYHFLSAEGTVTADPEVARELSRQLRQLHELVESVKKEGGFASDIPTAWIVAATDALIYASWTSVHQGYVARRSAGDLLIRTLFQGVGS